MGSNSSCTLLLGDCLERMKEIESGSIDCILTDPPYGMTGCKWDSVIPLEPMWEQLRRIIEPKGAIVLFGTEPFSSSLRMSNPKDYRYDWIWQKNIAGNFQIVKYQPLKKHELISVFSLKVHNYYPQGLKDCDITKSNKRKDGKVGNMSSEKVRKEYKQTKTGYPDANLFFKRPLKTIHATQKPVALMEYMIKTYTNEGEMVLDFTCGSGTTGVAAKNLNRRFIGIELDPSYYDIAVKRINSAA